jgi:hypothetical protein
MKELTGISFFVERQLMHIVYLKDKNSIPYLCPLFGKYNHTLTDLIGAAEHHYKNSEY